MATKVQKQFEAALSRYLQNSKAPDPVGYRNGWNKEGFKEKVHLPEDLPSTIEAPKAERNKLTSETVLAIRKDSETMKQSEISSKYGLPAGTVSGIINRKTWKNI